MRIHELKVASGFYPDLINGSKKFEIRLDDRGFLVSDFLWLREMNEEMQYTGSWVLFQVLYILDNEKYGTRPCFVIMSLSDPMIQGFDVESFNPYRQYLISPGK
jgi:hypothetical protein